MNTEHAAHNKRNGFMKKKRKAEAITVVYTYIPNGNLEKLTLTLYPQFFYFVVGFDEVSLFFSPSTLHPKPHKFIVDVFLFHLLGCLRSVF